MHFRYQAVRRYAILVRLEAFGSFVSYEHPSLERMTQVFALHFGHVKSMAQDGRRLILNQQQGTKLAYPVDTPTPDGLVDAA